MDNPIIRSDTYTDDLKIPVSPKEATHRYVYLWEDPDSTHITSSYVEVSENGFTDVDFEESTKDYASGEDMPEIPPDDFEFDEEDEEASEYTSGSDPTMKPQTHGTLDPKPHTSHDVVINDTGVYCKTCDTIIYGNSDEAKASEVSASDDLKLQCPSCGYKALIGMWLANWTIKPNQIGYEAKESNINRNPKGTFSNGGGNQTKSFLGDNTVDLSKLDFEEIKEGEEMSETKLHEVECNCNKKTFEKFVEGQLQSIKVKAKEGQSYGLLLDQPQVDGKKIKGTLAYAGVSLNNRLYLPEELAKGHGMTVPLIINHASTVGAEDELDRLPDKFRQGLENGLEMKVGQVSLTWEPEQLTLFYEGVIDDEFFQTEVDDADMAVSLGMYYDSDSPQVCDTDCYTMIKGAEFHEVSLVYHAGFPIATIEANEALLKKRSTESLPKKDLKDINWSD